MTLTLVCDGVLALRQGRPCEASPATRIFGFSQPPAPVETPSRPPARGPRSPWLPRSAQARLVVDHNTVAACRIKKNINNAQFRSPLHTRAAPLPALIIVSFLLPACRPNRQNHTPFPTTSPRARYHCARLVYATTAAPITPGNSHRSPCNHVGRKQLARAPAQVGPRRVGTDRGPQGVCTIFRLTIPR
jgi:hypothetical protein